MSTEIDKNSLVDQDQKNKLRVHCIFCPSRILNAGTARLVNIEFSLPRMGRMGKDEVNQPELLSDYWLVEYVYGFENIGVSHVVHNVKYLACADCERGPVGWHDLTTRKSYIALGRVKYE